MTAVMYNVDDGGGDMFAAGRILREREEEGYLESSSSCGTLLSVWHHPTQNSSAPYLSSSTKALRFMLFVTDEMILCELNDKESPLEVVVCQGRYWFGRSY
jgi:hypothetical protein